MHHTLIEVQTTSGPVVIAAGNVAAFEAVRTISVGGKHHGHGLRVQLAAGTAAGILFLPGVTVEEFGERLSAALSGSADKGALNA